MKRTRTKAFLAFLFCLFVLGIWTIPVKAEEELSYGDFTYVVEDDGVIITGYSGSSTSLVIPDSINGQTVKTIDREAFKGTGLKEVIFNTGLETIRYEAFYGCSELTKAEFSDTITTIGDCAFERCNKLEDLVLPKNLETIGGNVFTSPLIEELVIPSSLSRSGSPFWGCENLQKVTFEEGTKEITGYILDSQKSVTEVKIPEGVESIGESAFEGCESLTEIVFPESLKRIDREAFKLKLDTTH